MLCRKCGTEISEGFRFCTTCGELLRKPEMPVVLQKIEAQPCPLPEEEQKSAFSMKWYKFLIYFALFAAAAAEFLMALLCFTGLCHGSAIAAKRVYLIFPAWRVLDILLGILLVLFAAFSIYTRLRLSGCCKDGPICLYLSCAADAVFWIVQIVGAILIISGAGCAWSGLIFVPLLVSIVTAAAAIVLNHIYFKKRKDLFQK